MRLSVGEPRGGDRSESESPRRAPRAPWSDRLCDGVCVVFAVWTLCCHLVVARQGSLLQLLSLFALAAVATLVGWIALRRSAGAESTAPAGASASGEPDRSRRLRLAQGAGLLLGPCAAVALGGADRAVALWWAAVSLMLAAAPVLALSGVPRAEAARASRRLEAGLWTMAAACAVLVLVVHRPDLDDAFYVNLAVAAADLPRAPLLVEDTLHGIAGFPLHNAIYRVHSYELWNGAISFLTGIPAIYCFHWIAAVLAALLVPLAHAKLFRLLAPRVWLWGVAALLVVLVAAGDTHRWYGNFAFVRLWQGKGIYLFVFAPLIYAYGIRFALDPRPRRWLLLLAAQIASVGCSSSAIWAASAGALMALCCGLRPTRAGLRVLALGALSSCYVLSAGWLFRDAVQANQLPMLADAAFGERLAEALTSVLGEGHLRTAGLAATLTAFACCPSGLARRFAVVFPLAVWLVLLSPYWNDWVVTNLTGPSFWRALWSLPLPILMALVLIAPLHLAEGGARGLAARAASAALWVGFAVGVPTHSTLSPKNQGAGQMGIRIGAPGLKVPEEAYRWAAALNASVPPGSQVVAPLEISVWIPTFHHHAHPVMTRLTYMIRFQDRLGAGEVRDRVLMNLYSGDSAVFAEGAGGFRAGLDRFDVDGVCLRNSVRAGEAREILRSEGFAPRLRSVRHEIWVRSEPTAGDREPDPASS